MIKKIALFPNNNDISLETCELLKKKLIVKGYIIDDDFDLAIAVGGDGAFLRTVKKTNFNSNPYYVGINTGTLGFLQEVSVSKIDNFIEELKHEKYKTEEIGIQETIVSSSNCLSSFKTLNEIVIRDKNLNIAKLDISIDDNLLEKFAGDGILVSTSIGSTAYNLSLGGSIVYTSFDTLQITPMAPLNSKAYRSLLNSVIVPSHKEIKVVPENENDLLLSIDGENKYFDDVDYIKTELKDKKIKCLRLKHYNFPEKINEKLLKD